MGTCAVELITDAMVIEKRIRMRFIIARGSRGVRIEENIIDDAKIMLSGEKEEKNSDNEK